MIKTKHYELDSDGRVFAVTIAKNELTVNKDIVAKFAADVGSKMLNLIDSGVIGDGAVGRIGLSCKTKMAVFTIPVGVMPMRAVFTIKNGLLMPDFTSTSNDLMDLKWTPPSSMRLYLMVNCPIGPLLSADHQFLVAVDSSGRTYRLPTSNTYEDCRLCTGAYNSEGQTFIDVLSRAWTQFQSSRWQRDLNDRGGKQGMANSMAMFRYKALAKEGFEQLSPEVEWQELCLKISNEHITNNIIL